MRPKGNFIDWRNFFDTITSFDISFWMNSFFSYFFHLLLRLRLNVKKQTLDGKHFHIVYSQMHRIPHWHIHVIDFFMRFYFMSIHFISFFSSLHIDAYAVPANFLEIDVVNPMTTITAGKKRFTDYEVRMRVSVMIMCFIWRIPIDTGAGIFILSFMKCDDEFLSFPKKWAFLLHAFYVCVSMGLAIIRSIH